jgi:hypothetical protein
MARVVTGRSCDRFCFSTKFAGQHTAVPSNLLANILQSPSICWSTHCSPLQFAGQHTAAPFNLLVNLLQSPSTCCSTYSRPLQSVGEHVAAPFNLLFNMQSAPSIWMISVLLHSYQICSNCNLAFSDSVGI